MPSLSSLPVELLDIILDFLDEQEKDVRIFYSLVVVDRKLHSVARPRLYSRFNYDADKHDPASLWKYYTTIYNSFELSQRVSDVSIKYRSTELRSKRSKAREYQQNLKLVRQAASAAGLVWSHDERVSIARDYNEVPLLVLLLTMLPNVKTLDLRVPRHQERYRERHRRFGYFEELFKIVEPDTSAGRRPRALALLKLRSVRIESAKSPHGNSLEESSITATWWCGLLFLPCLREVTLLDLDPNRHGSGFEGRNADRQSKVTHWTMVHHPVARVEPDTLQWILNAPRTLVSLSIHLRDHRMAGYQDWTPCVHYGTNQELWQLLQQHCGTLEHFDYYRDTRDVQHAKQKCGDSPMGPIKMFKKLSHLCIHPETLLGGHYGVPVAPYHLRDTLPMSIQRLTLYGGPGMFDISTLHGQIIEVLEAEKGKILSLTLEDIVLKRYPIEASRARKEAMFENVREVCCEKDIEFRLLDDRTA